MCLNYLPLLSLCNRRLLSSARLKNPILLASQPPPLQYSPLGEPALQIHPSGQQLWLLPISSTPWRPNRRNMVLNHAHHRRPRVLRIPIPKTTWMEWIWKNILLLPQSPSLHCQGTRPVPWAEYNLPKPFWIVNNHLHHQHTHLQNRGSQYNQYQ